MLPVSPAAPCLTLFHPRGRHAAPRSALRARYVRHGQEIAGLPMSAPRRRVCASPVWYAALFPVLSGGAPPSSGLHSDVRLQTQGRHSARPPERYERRPNSPCAPAPHPPVSRRGEAMHRDGADTKPWCHHQHICTPHMHIYAFIRNLVVSFLFVFFALFVVSGCVVLGAG